MGYIWALSKKKEQQVFESEGFLGGLVHGRCREAWFWDALIRFLLRLRKDCFNFFDGCSFSPQLTGFFPMVLSPC